MIIPKLLLGEMGLQAGDDVELSLEGETIVLAPVRGSPRAGWADAARAIAETDDDQLAWPEFGNSDDGDLAW